MKFISLWNNKETTCILQCDYLVLQFFVLSILIMLIIPQFARVFPVFHPIVSTGTAEISLVSWLLGFSGSTLLCIQLFVKITGEQCKGMIVARIMSIRCIYGIYDYYKNTCNAFNLFCNLQCMKYFLKCWCSDRFGN